MGFPATFLLAAALVVGPDPAPGITADEEPPPDPRSARPATLWTTLPAGTWEAALPIGTRLPPTRDASPEFWTRPTMAIGLGDRWQLSLFGPDLAYRFGEPEGTEWVVSLGQGGFGYFRERGATILPATSLAFRRDLGGGRAVLLTAVGATTVEWGAAGSREIFEAWRLAGAVGWSQRVGEWITLTPGLVLARWEDFPAGFSLESGASLAVGSVVGVAGRQRPLVQVHLTPDLSLDGHASFEWDRGPRRWSESFALGSTWTF